MIYIDKYAYTSALKNVDPEFKIIFALVSLVVCLCSTALISYIAVLISLSAITVFKAKIPLAYYLKLMILPFGFLLISTLTIIVSITMKTPNPSYNYLELGALYFYVTPEGIALGVKLVLRCLGTVSCLYFLILTTPIPHLTAFLHKLKCPKIILQLLVLVYRFIFLLIEKSVTKIKSQQCRFGYARAKNFSKSFGMLWGSVFIQSYISGEAVYNSMLSRGYTGEVLYLPKETRFNVKHALIIIAFQVFIISLNFIR